MRTIEKLLESFKLVHKVSVEWGEMDAAQHVNNTVYLRWCESARIAYFQKMKVDISSSVSGSVSQPSDEGIILGYVDCKYIYPVTFPDTIHIGVRILAVKSDRMLVESHLFSEQLERIVAISKQEVLPYNYLERKKVPVSKSMIERIELIEAQSISFLS